MESLAYWDDNAPDHKPYVGMRLYSDYAGTDGYRLNVLHIRDLNGVPVSGEVEEFLIPAGATESNVIETVADEDGEQDYLLPVEFEDINDHSDTGDDVTITHWDTSQDIANENIAWIDAHTSDQDAAPRMPQLEFRVPGLPDGLTIEAKLFVEYERPYAEKQGEDTVRIPANGNFVQINGDTWEIYNEADWQTELNDRGFFGGDAKLTYQIKQGANIVVGPEEIDFAIGGENPADDRCKQYTQSRPGAPWYAYAIEKHESQAYNPGFYNQFWERSGNSSPINGGINYEFTLGDPLKVLSPGETGVGGTGLAQVTGAGGNKNNPAACEIFWNWQRNVDAFLAILADKIQIAETFMNDPTPRSGPGSMPNGQRPQTTFHTGQNVPVPSRDQANVTFGDNQGERRPEDAVAIKAYNGASAHWCSWRGPAVHEWQWNYGQNNYVERVCEQVEEEEEE
ncbi:hypothetical protein ACFQY0_09720 [Haloferula chungangensis]|uniref:Uncharacterized protein n=2 Tax=Haloferula chungangensis TaxID=1048331 RepID=A0ABW2L511_9BACT